MVSSPNGSYKEFRKTTLPNGIRIVTESIDSVRSVSVGAWVYAGSRDEVDEDAGICHFIEHMVFKGTKKRRMHQIAQRMESVGGYLNAFTTKEYTCFFARALDENLDRAIDTVTDLILSPIFPARELEKEKDVVVEEMRMYEDTPEEYVFDLLEQALYDGHPMGRPIIGHESSVRSFNSEKLHGFVDDHFTPNRIVIAAAGNVNHDKVVRMTSKAFAGCERMSSEVERIPVNSEVPSKKVVHKPIQQAHLVLGTRSFGVDDPRRFALTVLNTIVGDGMSSNLNQNIREKYGYCYNIYSFANLHSDTGDFGVYMGMDASKVDRARTLIFRELDRLAQKKISQRRLQQARNQVKGSIMLGLEGMGSRMMRLGRQELYYNAYSSLDEVLAQVESVSSADVLTLAQTLFGSSHFSEVVLLPE